MLKFFGVRNETTRQLFDNGSDENPSSIQYEEHEAQLVSEILPLFDGSRIGGASAETINRLIIEKFKSTPPDPGFETQVQRSIGICCDSDECAANPKVDGDNREETNNFVGCPAQPKNFIGALADANADNKIGKVSAIQVFPNSLQFTGTNAGNLQLFFNFIPTIEMSRAVPYLDVNVISNAPSTKDDSNRPGGLSQFSFLLQNGELRQYDIDNLAGQVLAEGEVTPTEIDGTIAGMELFTSPQTLVNADDDFFEPAVVGNESGRERYETPVIDKFRPFMTLKEINLKVVPAYAASGYRSATMSLVLHDRSRLATIAPFVQPDLYGNTEILIEYGWSHPGAENDADNPIGKFINGLRRSEKFAIVNSSYTFDENGQVDIELSLVTKGAVDLEGALISEGAGVKNIYEPVQNALKALNEAADKLAKSGTLKDLLGKTIISSLSSTSRAMTAGKKLASEVREIINKNKNTEEGALKDLVNKLQVLYGDDGEGGEVGKAQSTIQEALNQQVELLKTGPDPFASPYPMPGAPWPEGASTIGVTGTGEYRFSDSNYVSLGKLMMIYIGKAFANKMKYDEVQFVFYGFNEFASYFRNYNISQFPIEIESFKSALTSNTGEDNDMTINQFMNFINDEFIDNKLYGPWGFSSFYGDVYERVKDKKTGKLVTKIKEGATDEAKAAISDKITETVAGAYPEGSDVDFKFPQLQIHIDAVPMLVQQDGENKLKLDRNKTVLRIYVYDKVASATMPNEVLWSLMGNDPINTGETQGIVGQEEWSVEYGNQAFSTLHDKALSARFQDAISKELIGEKTVSVEYVKGLGFEDSSIPDSKEFKYRFVDGSLGRLKEYLRTQGPSAIVGSEYSPIQAARLQSLNDPALATIKMKQFANDTADEVLTTGDYGIPALIQPSVMTVDMLGNPLINFTEKIYIDFNTTTNADSYYYVIGVDHKITENSFLTTLKMQQDWSFEQFRSPRSLIKKALEKGVSALEGSQDDAAGSGKVTIQLEAEVSEEEKKAAAARGEQPGPAVASAGEANSDPQTKEEAEQQQEQNDVEDASALTRLLEVRYAASQQKAEEGQPFSAVEFSGLDDKARRDKLSSENIYVVKEFKTFEGEIDDLFYSSATPAEFLKDTEKVIGTQEVPCQWDKGYADGTFAPLSGRQEVRNILETQFEF